MYLTQLKTQKLGVANMVITLILTYFFSEMAQFFLKMAQAIKKKKLKPGQTIPGCNSYFLCKYLKGTMLQARTYLFCAIRPECKYLNYIFINHWVSVTPYFAPTSSTHVRTCPRAFPVPFFVSHLCLPRLCLA